MNYGGTETLIMNWYRNIDRKKYQFDFLVHTEEQGVYDSEIQEMGGHIYRVPKFTVVNYFNYKNSLRTHFKNHKEHQVVHGHVRSTAKIYTRIAKENKSQTIIHSHSTGERNGFGKRIKILLEKEIAINGDKLLSCSESAGRWLFKELDFEIIPNAIDTNKFLFDSNVRKRMRDGLKLEDDVVLFGHVGRFTEEKNHTYLLKVFSGYAKKNDNIRLLLIGEGKLKEKIVNEAIQNGVYKKVIFIDSSSNIEAYMMAMDIFLFPSRIEGLGIAVIEAQASGLLVIASANIPIETKLTTNIIYCDYDVEQWIELISEKTLSLSMNCAERQIFNNKVQRSQYSIESGLEKIERVYRELLEEI
ncbi:glycosyltransferase [Vagococcus salmoninarum]|uniref:glycosyltransferase n=1 Tax=Vagococcus salmoninarum TaxID=2739 RepID=UPI00187E8A62|nr:glycosyltransferase [Vagococcus salmoninarum]MBE9387813.1 glycosyltransferase [Vagococcus salmoninarum]